MIELIVSLLIIYILVFFNYTKLVSIIYSEKSNKKWPVFVGILVPIVIISVSLNMNNEGKFVMTYIGAVLAFFLRISGNLKERIGKTLEMFFMSECLEGITLFILELSGVLALLDCEDELQSYLLEYIIIADILCIIEFVKQKKRVQWQRLWSSLASKLYYWIVIMAVSMILTISCLSFAKDYVVNDRFAVAATWFCAISYLSIGILSMFVFYIKRTNEHMKQLLQREILARNMQQHYYEELLAKEEETRKYRHDMSNHLMCINSLAKAQKVDDLIDYIQHMQMQMNEIQKKTYKVGNQILDIVTNYYLNMLSPEIDIKISGRADGRLIIDSSDLCTIYANLLNNAVEELAKVQEGYLYIDFCQGDEYFQMIIRNSLSPESQNKENILFSDKEDKKNHGLGLKNVRRVVEENNGKIDISFDKEKFEVNVILKINDRSTS